MSLNQQRLSLLVLASMVACSVGLSAPEECWPDWYDDSSELSANDQCPYGVSLPGSVTWHTDMHPIERLFNVLYGYMSFAIPLLAGVLAVISRGTREVLFVGSIGIAVTLNEYCLKNIILEPKPLGACAITCGMPSGHACTTIQYFVLLMIDYAFRLTKVSHEGQVSLRRPDRIKRVLRLMSNSNTDAITMNEFVALFFVWGLLLLPTPFSRVTNSDHTVKQVLVGSALGLACGVFTYALHYTLARTICRNSWQWPRETTWFLMKNTIVPVGSQGGAQSAPTKFLDVESPASDSGAEATSAEEKASREGLPKYADDGISTKSTVSLSQVVVGNAMIQVEE